MLIGEVTISCVFENCQRDREWMFTDVYNKGLSSERESCGKI